jgi:hypothetical protein
VGGVRKALHEWDSNGDGAVTGADLLRGMQSAGVPMSAEDCARIAAATDPSEGGSALSEGFLSMGTIVRLLRFDLALPTHAPVGGGTATSSGARRALVSLEPAQSRPARSVAAAPGAATTATPESRAVADRAMLKTIQAAIDDNGGQRRLFRKWDTNGSRGLSAAQLHAGVNQMYETAVSLDSCARITNAFGTGTLSMGELVRVLGGDIPLPATGAPRPSPGSAAGAVAGPGAGPGAKRSLYPRTAQEEEIDATPAAGATSVEFAAARGRRHGAEGAVGGAAMSAASPLSSLTGVGGDEREAFNRCTALLAECSTPALVARRDGLILAAVATCIDSGGGAARFFSKWDKDNDHMLSARELRRGLCHEGLLVTEQVRASAYPPLCNSTRLVFLFVLLYLCLLYSFVFARTSRLAPHPRPRHTLPQDCATLIATYGEAAAGGIHSGMGTQRMTMRELKGLLSASAPLPPPPPSSNGGDQRARAHNAARADSPYSPFGSSPIPPPPPWSGGRRIGPGGGVGAESVSSPPSGRKAIHAPGGEDHINFSLIGMAADHVEFQNAALGMMAADGSGASRLVASRLVASRLVASPALHTRVSPCTIRARTQLTSSVYSLTLARRRCCRERRSVHSGAELSRLCKRRLKADLC